MSKMKRTRYSPPYRNGRTLFPDRKQPGVYLIRIGGELRYVGHSKTDVYKTLYRHFQTWNDSSRDRERVTYTAAQDPRVRVIYTGTAKRAVELERALILKHQPRDNPDKFAAWELDANDHALMKEADNAAWAPLVEVPF